MPTESPVKPTERPNKSDHSERGRIITHLNWVFVLEEDYWFDLKPYLPNDFFDGRGCAFVDKKNVRRLEIHPDGKARVLKDYAWDGCTPKFSFWDIVVGTPDGRPHPTSGKPMAYHASLVHDALYQFLGRGIPVSRATADRVFLDLLAHNDFGPRRFYWLGVRIFGRLTLIILRWKRDYDGRRVEL